MNQTTDSVKSILQPQISLQGFSVWSGDRWLVKDVSADLPSGAWCVLLGPNGSGKTTLLKALAGVLPRPWHIEGDFQRAAKSPQNRPAALAWVGQSLHASEDMAVSEFVATSGHLFASGRATSPARLNECAEAFGLKELLDLRLSTLSGGQWQRVRLAQGLSRDADLILLDEPDSFLDARWRWGLWNLLERRRSSGATVITALHRFVDVRAWASHWWGLDDGALVFNESRQGVFPSHFVQKLFLEKSLTR
jgi:iron complex transport system ATP-binding protein